MSDTGNLFLRNDTFFGVCEAIGEDFGFNANWLRVAFAGALFFSPVGTIAFYLALGIVVAGSRLLFPRPANAIATDVSEAPAAANVDADLPIAA